VRVDLYEKMVGYFEQDSWAFRRIDEHRAVEMSVAGENGTFRLVAIADEERNILRFLTFIEGKVPEARRREVMEYFTRANYGLLLGNFEMDLGDGEVRFKCSVDLEGIEISYPLYQNLLYVSVGMVDRYFPGFQRVLQGSADPAAAVSDIET
jgi:hypothetical protein